MRQGLRGYRWADGFDLSRLGNGERPSTHSAGQRPMGAERAGASESIPLGVADGTGASWSAPAERERRRRFWADNDYCIINALRECESGVALRLPPQSKTGANAARRGKINPSDAARTRNEGRWSETARTATFDRVDDPQHHSDGEVDHCALWRIPQHPPRNRIREDER